MKHRPLHREKPNLLALEARYMFDGAAIEAAASVIENPQIDLGVDVGKIVGG